MESQATSELAGGAGFLGSSCPQACSQSEINPVGKGFYQPKAFRKIHSSPK